MNITTYIQPILDNKGTTEHTRVSCQKFLYSQCSKCETWFFTPVFCDRRDCQDCQKRRANRLYNSYKEIVAGWKQTETMRINFLTLTNKNVPFVSKEYLKERDGYLKKFLLKLKRLGYFVDYGFRNKEVTFHAAGDPRYFKGRFNGYYDESNSGFHYHFHILFYGPFIDLKSAELNLSKIWKEITGDSWRVHLYSKFNDGDHSLRYILKYACKVQENSPAMRAFYEISKGSRNFQSFGKRYKMQKKEKLPFCCSNCGAAFRRNRNRFDSFFFEVLPHGVEAKKLIRLRIKLFADAARKRKHDDMEANMKFADIGLSKDEFMIQRIFEHLGQRDNYDTVAGIIGDAGVSYLLTKGLIFESPRGTLRENS